MGNTENIEQARLLIDGIKRGSIKIEALKRMGVELQKRDCNRAAILHLSRVYKIVLYNRVLRPVEAKLLKLQNTLRDIAEPYRDSFFGLSGELSNYANVCDYYHRQILRDGGVDIWRAVFKWVEPSCPVSFPQRIELPSEAFTPIKR